MKNHFISTQAPSKAQLARLAIPVRALHAGHRAKVLDHFLKLNEEDRRMRFGTQTPDEVLKRYVENINFNKDTVLGIFDAQLNIIGIAHLAYLPAVKHHSTAVEFGVSVLPGGRAQGLGAALLGRAAIHSRNTQIDTLFVHCLANNRAMMHLAKKAGMQVEYAYGDADAYLKLPPANPGTIVVEAANEQWADFDYALKANLKHSNDAWSWFLGRPAAFSTKLFAIN